MDHDNDDESGDGDDVNDWGENDDDWGDGGVVEIEDDDEDNNDDDDEEKIEDKVMDKFILTFTNGNYDDEFDDELSTDRGLIVPARATQASYNKPDNWRERNRIGLEKVKRQLQGFLRSATVLHDVHLNLDLNHISRWNQQYMDNDEPIVWHEPILDRYWDVLEAEIDSRKQQEIVTDIKRIHIINIEVKKERLAALVAIFRNGRAYNSSTFVNFNNVHLCADGIISLSELVDVSSELQTLVIMNNRIDNMEPARCLSRSLKSHTCVFYLDITHCDLGSSPEILSVNYNLT